MSPEDRRHGTTAGHKAHLTDGESACLDCRRAKTRYEKNRAVYGNLMVPAIGTRRRIRALKALGHSGAEIAARIGVTYQAIHKIEHNDSDKIFARTADNIRRAYDEMCMVIPNGYHRTRIRNAAARMGYAPPLAWDDIDDPDEVPDFGGWDEEVDVVVVMRLLEGQRITASVAEKEAAMAQWVRDGGSRNELARIHGWRSGRYAEGLRLIRGGAA